MNIFLFQVREIGVTIDPDAVHDVIDSLFRLGRNASDYSPLAQCSALSGEIEKDLLISLLLQKFRILTLEFFATGATFFVLKDQLEFFYTYIVHNC